ncbi:MAG TPA: glycosyltransferase 87 family protein [Ktedonobacteraceae bacterium]|nr:glycosyltransferase 87 family protein [Ktedonobacteraceae bacterium]
MSELKDANAPSEDETTPSEAHATEQNTERIHPWTVLLDACVIVAMGAILFWGAAAQFSNKYNDATRYQCYAISFWQGSAGIHTSGLDANSKSQCAFLDTTSSATLAEKMRARHFPSFLVSLVQSQSTAQSFHALPPEYPLLTLAIFSLPLLAPMLWYQVAFALLMAIAAAILYLVITHYRSRPAAIVFAFYLALGSWATAFGRFDLVPAGLTLGAVILAARERWNWAYVLLALATLLKLYPAIFIPIFLIAQQKQTGETWKAWKRWQGFALYIGVSALVTLVSLLLNVANTLFPINFFLNRPIQVESFGGTLLWLGNFVGYHTQYIFTYQSLNFTSLLSHKVSLLTTFLLVVGLLYTFWLQWRGKLDIYTASLLTLLLIVILGKVFSPQYLIWITPFIAYIGKYNWKWVLSWGAVCALTTFVYPFNYVDIPHINHVYPAIIARDLLILAIVLVLLYQATSKQFVLE